MAATKNVILHFGNISTYRWNFDVNPYFNTPMIIENLSYNFYDTIEHKICLPLNFHWKSDFPGHFQIGRRRKPHILW